MCYNAPSEIQKLYCLCKGAGNQIIEALFAMPKLKKHEIKQHRAWFQEWRDSSEMLEYANCLMDDMASDTPGEFGNISAHLFNQTGVGFIHEAWAAATFAGYRNADKVRLAREDPPDFQLCTADGIENWELTEALDANRRRGAEYSESAARAARGEDDLELDPIENWHARARQIPIRLKECATKKAAKNYSPDTRLLIYLNIDDGFGTRQKEVEECMADSTKPAKNDFAEVWGLWKHQTYPLWQYGKPHAGRRT